MYWLLWNTAPGEPAKEKSSAPSKSPKRPLRKSAAATCSQPEPEISNDEVTLAWEEYSDEILCLITPERGCFHVSANLKPITGHSAKACEGDGVLSLVHADYRKKLLGKMGELAGAADKQSDHFKCQMRHADGKYQWYDLRLVARKQEEELTFCCFLRNIQDEMLTQKKLQKAKLEAELALKGRSEFLANMSHELRTPLNAIIGFAQMMENHIFGKIENARYREYISNIHDSGNALLSKINDLLEVSNLEAGRVTLSVEPADLLAVIRHAIEIQSHHAFANQVRICEEFLKFPVQLKADRVKLTQALSNILSNAIRYNEPGGEVHIATAFTGRGDLLITIRDTGTGIPSKDLRNIVASFEQESNLFTRSRSIIGLGLALAKEFVALHSGHLSMESREGAGTTVTVTLPRECIIAQPASKGRGKMKQRASA